MESRGVPLILVTHLVNIRYLTGFTGSAGIALLGPRQGVLWVDPRYALQAQEQAEGVEVIEETKGILKGAAHWFKKNEVRMPPSRPPTSLGGNSSSFAQKRALA